MSFVEVLDAMRVQLKRKNFEQIPQLTSTRELDLTHKFDLVPDGFSGTKYAVMIGINYVGHSSGELVRLFWVFVVVSMVVLGLVPWMDFMLMYMRSLFFLSPFSADATMMWETWYVCSNRDTFV